MKNPKRRGTIAVELAIQVIIAISSVKTALQNRNVGSVVRRVKYLRRRRSGSMANERLREGVEGLEASEYFKRGSESGGEGRVPCNK